MGSSGQSSSNYDLSFKDSAVGKSSLLVSFISNSVDDLAPTTAGQERFRTLTSSYYRNARGIILVYDVTRTDIFTNLWDVWAKEVELYWTNQDSVKVLVGNRVDRIMEIPSLSEEASTVAKRNMFKQKQENQAPPSVACCS